MTKSLVIINEPFGEMLLGKNTTLFYIIAASDLNEKNYEGGLGLARKAVQTIAALQNK